MPRRPHLARALAAAAACAVAASLAVAAPTAASAAGLPLSATDQAVHDRLAVRSQAHTLGPDLAGAVVDAATGAVVWGRTTHEAQIPASNAKILTAVDALEVFGPTHTFTTSVWTGATSHQLVLYGGGDPALSTAQLGTMARSNADLQRVIDRVLAANGVVRASTVIALDTQISARVLPLLHEAAGG